MIPTSAVITAMMIWISTVTGLPIPSISPSIEYSDGRTMKLLLYGCDLPGESIHPEICKEIRNMDTYSRIQNNTLGLYDHHNHRIFLNPSIKDMDSVVSDSIVVHELVHAMQFPAKVPYKCMGQLEELAYDTQSLYLLSQGRKDIFIELDLSPLFLFITVTCNDGALGPPHMSYDVPHGTN